MFENIKIIGTSHISSDSIKLIKKTFLEFKPDVIAVELDKDRLFSLEHPQKESNFPIKLIRTIGFTGFLFALFGKYAQKKLGNIVKLKAGSDMMMAVTLAKKNKLELILIDRHINITLKRFSQKFKFKEKFQIFKDIFSALFSKKARMKFDLSKVPEDELIDSLIEKVKDSYPSLYLTLIDERNHFMSRNLIIFHKKNPNKKILCVVGAGHKKEMEKLLPIYNKKIELI
ncbi:MAG: TraB/GumN family protein [Candidatus Woesearchaeota archaeon]